MPKITTNDQPADLFIADVTPGTIGYVSELPGGPFMVLDETDDSDNDLHLIVDLNDGTIQRIFKDDVFVPASLGTVFQLTQE